MAKTKTLGGFGSILSFYTPPKPPAKGVPRPSELPPPPIGTYDPSLDYNAGAARRGYEQTVHDAETAYDQGQQDYGLNLGDLTRSRDRRLADLNTQIADVSRQYSILGHQQAQSARQHGITSPGLLALSAQKRSENQAHDIAPLNLAIGRTNEDFTNSKQRLDLANARQFGGFEGHQIINPLTGQPEYGSLLTQVTRAGGENTAYQTALGQQKAFQAQQLGYVAPGPTATGTRLAASAFSKKQRKK